MTTYKVIPINPKTGPNEGSGKLAGDLEALLQKYAEMGWRYERIETLRTLIPGNKGCFGIGCFGFLQPTPDSTHNFQMLVLSREDNP